MGKKHIERGYLRHHDQQQRACPRYGHEKPQVLPLRGAVGDRAYRYLAAYENRAVKQQRGHEADQECRQMQALAFRPEFPGNTPGDDRRSTRHHDKRQHHRRRQIDELAKRQVLVTGSRGSRHNDASIFKFLKTQFNLNIGQLQERGNGTGTYRGGQGNLGVRESKNRPVGCDKKNVNG